MTSEVSAKAQRPENRSKCCCCIPQDIGIKLFILWPVIALLGMGWELSEYSQRGEPLTPILAFCIILIVLCILVFFVPAMNTYGWRVALFWYWFNGMLLINLWSIYITNNTDWINFHDGPCQEQADRMVTAEGGEDSTAEYYACIQEKGRMSIVSTVVRLVVELYFALELYRYAVSKTNDVTDTSVTFCITKPTCCACIPLKWYNCAAWVIAVLHTLGAVGTATNGLKPMRLVALCLLPVAIIAWVVVCREACAKKPSKTWRMVLFWSQIIFRVILARIVYWVVIAGSRKELSAPHAYCKIQ